MHVLSISALLISVASARPVPQDPDHLLGSITVPANNGGGGLLGNLVGTVGTLKIQLPAK
jgi:hypothetical protein